MDWINYKVQKKRLKGDIRTRFCTKVALRLQSALMNLWANFITRVMWHSNMAKERAHDDCGFDFSQIEML